MYSTPVLVFFILFIQSALKPDFFLPIQTQSRQELSSIKLTSIGQFGLVRKERPLVPSHLHTGIDFARPNENYINEPVFPIFSGTVISVRNDGPFAQIIIRHQKDKMIFWTLYEHVSEIRVSVGDQVNPLNPIARFMNREELNKFGWQFDHFHFEILKKEPLKIPVNSKLPQRMFSAPTLTCFTETDLEKNYYNPVPFMTNRNNQ